MNPDLERILEKEEQELAQVNAGANRAKKAEMIKDVSDESMVKHYSSLVKTLGSKFKRRHPNEKSAGGKVAKQMKLDD